MGYQIHFNLILGHHRFLNTTYGLMDLIDPHPFIDVGLFVKPAVQISDACFEYRFKKKQDGTTVYGWPKTYHKKVKYIQTGTIWEDLPRLD